MDDWTLRENSDSPVGVNGFVDNMQMLWKLQSLDSLMPANDNDAPESFNEFNQSTSTDFPDSDELVEKLFLESMAMQQQGRLKYIQRKSLFFSLNSFSFYFSRYSE